MKKLSILIILIALISGCCRRPKIAVPVCPPDPAVSWPISNTEAVADKPADEELKAFELEEKENPFNNVSKPESESTEDFGVDPNDELMQQERYAHSSRHGFKTIYYDFNDPKIRPDQMNIINNNLRIAEELVLKGYEIVVEGHACNSAGSRDYNIHLSESRAQGIADYFVRNGFDRSRISTVGRGCEMLIVPAGTREQQSPNRRVEIYAYPARSKKHSKYHVQSEK